MISTLLQRGSGICRSSSNFFKKQRTTEFIISFCKIKCPVEYCIMYGCLLIRVLITTGKTLPAAWTKSLYFKGNQASFTVRHPTQVLWWPLYAANLLYLPKNQLLGLVPELGHHLLESHIFDGQCLMNQDVEDNEACLRFLQVNPYIPLYILTLRWPAHESSTLGFPLSKSWG